MNRLCYALTGLIFCASAASAQVLYGPAAIHGGTIDGVTITNSKITNQSLTGANASGASVTAGSNTQTLSNWFLTPIFNSVEITSLTTNGGVPLLSTPIASANGYQTIMGLSAGVGLNSSAFELTAIGYQAAGASGTGLTGPENTLVGWHAGNVMTTGQFNTAVGVNAMGHNTTGLDQIAIGTDAMRNAVDASNSIAIGVDALREPSMQFSIAIGGSALKTKSDGTTAGSSNIAIGYNTLQGSNATNISNNVMIGNNSGTPVTSANNNTSVGSQALQSLTSGTLNVVLGSSAMNKATTDAGNVAIGTSSLFTAVGSTNNVAVGVNAGNLVTIGSSNTIIGANVGKTTLTTGSNNILIGTSAAVDVVSAAAANEINIGGLLFWNNASTAAPAVTACGTSPTIDVHANNRSGTVTVGTATPTSCTITFAGTAYSTWNHCRVTPLTALAAFAYSYNNGAITLTGSALSGKVDYDCDGV